MCIGSFIRANETNYSALDSSLDLKPGATKKELEGAMGNHVLAQGRLIGTYKRK